MILVIKNAESYLSECLLSFLYFGTGKIRDTQLLKRFGIYKTILQEEIKLLNWGGKGCLNEDDLRNLESRIRNLAAICNLKNEEDQVVDSSKREEWILNNPYCVSKERWEHLSYAIFCKLDLVIENVKLEDACNIAVDFKTEKLSCDLLVKIDKYSEKCDLDLSIDTVQEKCHLEFRIISKINPCKKGLNLYKCITNKDFTYQDYLDLINEGVHYDLIKSVLSNNCCLTISEDGDVIVNTETNSYPLSTFKFKNKPDIKILKNLI